MNKSKQVIQRVIPDLRAHMHALPAAIPIPEVAWPVTGIRTAKSKAIYQLNQLRNKGVEERHEDW